ncbi:protein PSK SIMULATOR 1-like [Silene latifolia]|uniref:protein PSK SIMULATOR 1-like n=1 Tax=Silene latifolia TaxID=37657 RepID=UPI003D7759A0
MVAEPWLLKMGNQVSNNFKNSTLLHQISTKKKDPSPKIGILSFEIANIMSKLAYLHKSVCDTEISKLKNEIIKSEGVKKLVSFDECYLIELAYVERLNDLNSIAEVVSRLGKKCSEPVLLGFEHVYGDIISGKIEVKELGFLVKDMENMIRKMERYVDATTKLFRELEVLSELEESTKKFHLNQNVDCRRAFEQKVTWQRQDVKHLKEVSLWNLTYDKVVELLARTVCTLYARICFVFGNADVDLTRSCSRSGVSRSLVSVGGGSRTVSGVLVKVEGCEKDMNVEDLRILKPLNRFKPSPIERLERKPTNFSPRPSLQKREMDFVFPCAPSPGRIFTECLSFSTSASRVDDEDDDFTFNDVKKEQSIYSGCLTHSQNGVPYSREEVQLPYSMDASRVGSKSRLVSHATPSTVGGSALSLHYANVIIVIEKLLRYPHLVGEEARDDLYQMLPHSLRKSLRVNLRSHCKNFAIYDGALAHDWKETLDGILRWLAPLAHNMIRWQSERNVEQQQIVTRTNVLLLQTLFFADREKTEAAICDLLVGLNYICRYEHQQNALLDCAASFDFGDWMEWQLQLQCQGSCLN